MNIDRFYFMELWYEVHHAQMSPMIADLMAAACNARVTTEGEHFTPESWAIRVIRRAHQLKNQS